MGKSKMFLQVAEKFKAASFKQGWRAKVKIIPTKDNESAREGLRDFCQQLWPAEYESSRNKPNTLEATFKELLASDLKKGFLWLFCFENVTQNTPREFIQEIFKDPRLQNGCHVVFMSREEDGWTNMVTHHLRPLEATESRDWVLREIESANPETDSEILVERLRGVPLALELTCAHLKRTGIPIAEYLRDSDQDADPIQFALQTTLRFLQNQHTSARALLGVLAIFGPEINSEELQFIAQKCPSLSELPILLDFGLVKQDRQGKITFADSVFASLPAEHQPETLALAKLILGGAVEAESFAHLLIERGQKLYQRREFLGAFISFKRVLGVQTTVLGEPDSSLVSLTLCAVGRYLATMGSEQALTYLQSALSVRRATLPSDHLDISEVLAGIAEFHQSRGSFKEALDVQKEALEIRKKNIPEHPDTAQLLYDMGTSLVALRDTQGAFAAFQESLSIRQKVLPSGHSDIAFSLSGLGVVYEARGEMKNALGIFLEALELRRKENPVQPSLIASLLNQIGAISGVVGETETAIRTFQEFLSLFPPGDPYLPWLHNAIGILYKSEGHYLQALQAFQEALKLRRAEDPPSLPALAQLLGDLGTVHEALGDYPEALQTLRESLQIREDSLPSDHPGLAHSLNNFGTVFQALGDLKGALAAHGGALELRRAAVPLDHRAVAQSLNNLGDVHRAQGNNEKALQLLQEAREVQKKNLPAQHPEAARTLNNLGAVYHSLGNREAALRSFEEALAIHRRSFRLHHPDIATSLRNIGVLYGHLGEPDYEKAFSALHEALDILRKNLPAHHPGISQVLNLIGNLHWTLKDSEKALSVLQEALEIQRKGLLPTHPDFARSLENLCDIYRSLGENSRAFLLLRELLTIKQKILPPDHPEIAHLMRELSSIEATDNDQ
jgi:tetratricopeptide (TPR) repeat protein